MTRHPIRPGVALWLVWILRPSLVVAASAAANTPAPSDWLSAFVTQHGLGVGLLAVFLGGFLLNFTPCVYPMIPVTVAFFSQQAAGSLRRAAWLAGCYVIGMSLSYALLGVIAASTGALLGSWLQHPVVLIALALVIVGLALSLFGLYDLRPPQAITRRLGQASAGAWGAFLMGLVVGLVAAPCIGPFVLGLLVFMSKLGNPAAGFLVFFVLGLGMGLPYVVLGASAHRISQLPKAGAWLVWSKKGLGVVLLGVAVYFVRPLLPMQVLGLLVAGLCFGGGVYLGWLEPTHGRGRIFPWVRRGVGSALIVAALAIVWPHPPETPPVAWVPYSEAALEQAQRAHRPTLVDVYADWCLPCVEMDHVTFHHPDVVRVLSSMVTLRVDVTRDVPLEADALLTRYHIYGAPTILLFDTTGTERTDLRVTGFTTPDELLSKLSKIQ